MRILFDHNAPRQLRRHLVDHDVDVAEERGWATLVNGELLDRAEEAGYEVVITADRNMPYQQNIGPPKLRALIVLGANRWAAHRAKDSRIFATPLKEYSPVRCGKSPYR